MSLSKRQKLSDPQLEDLPDEVILEILGYLDSKGVIYCGHLSRRIRTISQDESLWQKWNLRTNERKRMKNLVKSPRQFLLSITKKSRNIARFFYVEQKLVKLSV